MTAREHFERVAPPALVYVIGTYPLLTTTFIDREIRLLRSWGVPLEVISLRRPGRMVSPEQEALRSGVEYVLPVNVVRLAINHLRFLLRRPVTFLGTLLRVLRASHPSMRARFKTLLHFGEGVEVAARIVREFPGCDRIHAHFADRAATVALVAGSLLEVPYSLTAHANDIYVEPAILREKISAASFVATCTQYNAEHLRRVAADHDTVTCIYHGLDARQYRRGDAAKESGFRLLAVGQLKEKKGFTYLIEACRLLREDEIAVSCEIIGEGPLRPDLEAQIREYGLDSTVTLRGALEHGDVVDAYRAATAFVLPCVTAVDGDRDGIPNVILEAMAMGLPVVSTRHSGIPEAVEHDVTGLLVAPHDAAALADALARLEADADGGRNLGREGRRRVVDVFDGETNVRRLLDRFLE